MESDAESDTLSERLRKIDAYNEDVHGDSQANEINSDQQVWFIEEDAKATTATQALNVELQVQKKLSSLMDDTHTPVVKPAAINSQEKAHMDEVGAYNSQESVVTNDGLNRPSMRSTGGEAEKMPLTKGPGDLNGLPMGSTDGEAEKMPFSEEPGGLNRPPMGKTGDEAEKMQLAMEDGKFKGKIQVGGPPQEERSEHLREGIHLTTKEKNDAMARKRNLEGNTKKSHTLADIENNVLNNLAMDMGIHVKDSNFDSFDVLKELENARNCLHLKHMDNDKLKSYVEIVKFVPSEDPIIDTVASDDDSDLEEMLIQQSKEKSKFGKKKIFSFSPEEEARPGRSWLARFQK